MLYLAVTGELPFPGDSANEVRRRIAGAPPQPLSAFGVGDQGLQQILRRLPASGEIDDAIRQRAGLRGVRDLAQQGGLADAGRAVDADRRSRLDGGERGGELVLAIHEAAHGVVTRREQHTGHETQRVERGTCPLELAEADLDG